MKIKEKDLDKWYEENRELPELDDYARMRNWHWGKGGYEEKLKVYFIFNPDKSPKDEEIHDVMNYKPKIGQHSLQWAMYNKFNGTSEWKKARENMMEIFKEDRKKQETIPTGQK